jgi:hypothetical protein
VARSGVDKSVKLTIELSIDVHRDLVAYGQVLARETGQAAIEPSKLIAPMLVRFVATDRAFTKLRRAAGASPPAVVLLLPNGCGEGGALIPGPARSA